MFFALAQVSNNAGHGICVLDSDINLSDCYISDNGRCGVRIYGQCIIAISHCDLSGNKESPAVSTDEFQDVTDVEEEVVVYIQNSVGDISSDPPATPWGLKKPRDSAVKLKTFNAYVGERVEVSFLYFLFIKRCFYQINCINS